MEKIIGADEFQESEARVCGPQCSLIALGKCGRGLLPDGWVGVRQKTTESGSHSIVGL